ncbi:MAG: hypothetical protein U1D30_04050 [Planctomycetota bacterium]
MARLPAVRSVKPEECRGQPDFWRDSREAGGPHSMPGSSRLLAWGLAFVASLAAVIGLAWTARHYWHGASQAMEVAVFFPQANAQTWTNFVAGVRLAAAEKNLRVEENREAFECLVLQDPTPLRFRWYPEVGSRGIQRRVSELCRRTAPPLAIVGANNSSLTFALAGEMSRHGMKDQIPILLMTTATADELIDILPDRSFRFGFNNTYQAQTVVDRLKRFFADRKIEKPDLNVIVVQVLDNPFSVDLARHFRHELREKFSPRFISPPTGFFDMGPVEPGDEEEGGNWSVETSTGGFDVPTEEERRLARELVTRMIAEPDKQWAIVLPLGTTPYRRISFALHGAFTELTDAATAQRVKGNLVILSGDSMDYFDFRDAIRNQLLPEETPAPVIFFAHVNPLDPTVANKPNPDASSQNLDRDVARALLKAFSTVGSNPTPNELAKAVAGYVESGASQPFFENRERRSGGGAIVASPRPDKQDFLILLPPEWQASPK